MPILPLTAARHARARLRPLPDMDHATRQNHVQLGLGEVKDALADYPIFLMKHADTGRFNLCALFGFDVGRSAYVIEGRWQATYLPQNLLRHPFFLDPNGGGVLDMAVEEMTDRLHDSDGEPLFNADGTPTARTLAMAAMLNALRDDLAAARGFIDTITGHDLLRPVDLVLDHADGRQHRVDGLYSIGADALRDLSDDAVLSLHRSGHLHIIHAIMASAVQVYRLQQLHNAVADIAVTRLTMRVRD